MTAEPIDIESLPEEEQKAYAMIRQAVEEVLTPLYGERWPEFEALMLKKVDEIVALTLVKEDDEMPKVLAAMVLDTVKPIYRRLERLESALFRERR